jgi:signal transduction histidine kinase
MTKLRQQERAMAARAEASEQLADQIVEGLTSAWSSSVARASCRRSILPRAAFLELGESGPGKPFRETLGAGDGALRSDRRSARRHSPIVRRTLTLSGARPRHLGVTVSHDRRRRRTLQAAVCLFTDSPRSCELEEQLRLKEALARLGELTAGLAHEFRNGLATIHGYGQLLDPDSLAAAGADLRRRHPRRDDGARRSGHELPALRASRTDWRWRRLICDRSITRRSKTRPVRRPWCGSKADFPTSTVTRCCCESVRQPVSQQPRSVRIHRHAAAGPGSR